MVTKYDNSGMDLDMAKLICAIKARRAIWDSKCELYADRTERVKQWEQVVNIFATPGMAPPEKRMLGICLQKKWRNMRDSFAKEERRLASLKTGPSDVKKQKHYDSLLFLKSVISARSQDQHRRRAKQERKAARAVRRNKRSRKRYEDSDSYSTSSSDDSLPRRRKKSKHNPSVEIREESKETDSVNADSIPNNPSLSQSVINTNEDPDRCFMLSLLDDFKSLPAKLKPFVKINIMKCIMEAQDYEADVAGPSDGNPLGFSPENPQESNESAGDTKPFIEFEVVKHGAG